MSDSSPPIPRTAEHSLFAVIVRSHGTSWRVLVRAKSDAAARSNVESRGHTVIGVEHTEMPKPKPVREFLVCPVCNYSLRGLQPGASGHVQCPECGAVPTEVLLPLRQLSSRNLLRLPAGCSTRAVLFGIAVALVVFGITMFM